MGHSPKHDKSKHDKSKRDGRKGTSSDKRSPHSSIIQLQALIANVEERQQSLARQHDEYRRLREQAENLQDRLENSAQTLALLSSTSPAAQQARGVASMSSHQGQQTIDRASRREHLEREVQTLSVSIGEYDRRADAMAELISRNHQEIEDLQARIYEIRAAEEAEAGWYGEQDGPDPGWGEPGSGGGTGGGGSHGYYGGGQASSSASYSQYAGAYT